MHRSLVLILYSCFASLLSTVVITAYLHSYNSGSISSMGVVKYSRAISDPPSPAVTNDLAPSRANASEFGYVMALSYIDEMTGSVANLISMQCWGSSMDRNLKVVEPFLRRSSLGVDQLHLTDSEDVSTSQGTIPVKLTDVFDKDEWDKMTRLMGFAPLISWGYFIRHAQRRVILVDRQCYGKKSGKCMGCKARSKIFLSSMEVFSRKYGFEVVRKVCYPLSVIDESEFNQLIYDGYTPHEVVVIFNAWGGINQFDFPFRVGIKVQQCNRMAFMKNMPLSFTTIRHDALRYTQKYLPEAVGEGYISVMVRLEQFALKHQRFKGQSEKTIMSLLMMCFKNILDKVRVLKENHGIKTVFLTMDCRHQGSGYFSRNVMDEHESRLMRLMSSSIENLYTMLYGNSSSLEQWDQSFYNVSSFTIPGYIAMLQKHLAANGTCLITAGGGAFQHTAHQLHSQYHPAHSRCAYVLSHQC